MPLVLKWPDGQTVLQLTPMEFPDHRAAWSLHHAIPAPLSWSTGPDYFARSEIGQRTSANFWRHVSFGFFTKTAALSPRCFMLDRPSVSLSLTLRPFRPASERAATSNEDSIAPSSEAVASKVVGKLERHLPTRACRELYFYYSQGRIIKTASRLS